MGDLNNERVITMSARQVNHCYANNNAWLSLRASTFIHICVDSSRTVLEHHRSFTHVIPIIYIVLMRAHLLQSISNLEKLSLHAFASLLRHSVNLEPPRGDNMSNTSWISSYMYHSALE